jgi:quercetin dioxygenase-like cupin family protein
MKTSSLQTIPYVQGDEKQRLLFLGALFTIKATSEQTNDEFNLFDVVCPFGYQTPLHINYIEDVAIYILEGTLEIFWGHEIKKATAGFFVYQPRGTPHGFRVDGNKSARILYMTIPAGFDQFVLDCAQQTDHSEEINAARHKIEVIGPLPYSEEQKEDQNE